MDDAVTPITLPDARVVRAPTNGVVVEEAEDETTGEHLVAAMASGSPEQVMAAFLAKASAHFAESNGDDGDGPGFKLDRNLKEMKRHRWLVPLLALIFGSGGMVGSYYALKAESAATATKIQAAQPVIEKNTEDIRLIKVDITKIGDNVGKMRTEQKALTTGVNTLKEEAQTEKQTRLEEKVKELERKNRQLERDSR